MKRLSTPLLLAESIFSLGSGLFLPIFAIYSESVGGDILDAGLAAATFLFVTSILQYPVGKLLDRYPGKWFVVGDYVLEAFVFLGYAFVETFSQLFLLQILLGIANAIGDPAWEALYDASGDRKRIGSKWANYHVATGILTAVGIVIGSYIASERGFDVLFVAGAIGSATAAVIAWWRID